MHSCCPCREHRLPEDSCLLGMLPLSPPALQAGLGHLLSAFSHSEVAGGLAADPCSPPAGCLDLQVKHCTSLCISLLAASEPSIDHDMRAMITLNERWSLLWNPSFKTCHCSGRSATPGQMKHDPNAWKYNPQATRALCFGPTPEGWPVPGSSNVKMGPAALSPPQPTVPEAFRSRMHAGLADRTVLNFAFNSATLEMLAPLQEPAARRSLPHNLTRCLQRSLVNARRGTSS